MSQSGSIANVDGSPPEDAYGRVTNPERFASLHAVARQLIDELVATYDVEASAAAPEPAGDNGAPARFDITALRTREGDTVLEIALTDFPGVEVRFGASGRGLFPSCGCDACDEQPKEVATELREYVDALIGGTYEEWWDGSRFGHRYVVPAGPCSGWTVVADDDPLHRREPFTRRHPAWSRRTA